MRHKAKAQSESLEVRVVHSGAKCLVRLWSTFKLVLFQNRWFKQLRFVALRFWWFRTHRAQIYHNCMARYVKHQDVHLPG